MAPRRYGKSSLVLHALKKGGFGFVEMDLQLCRSAKSLERKIIRGIEEVIASTVKEKENVLHTAKSFFKKNNKYWKVGLKGFVELTIEPDQYEDVTDNVLTALQFLDAVLLRENKKAILFMDEVQEINEIESSVEIQSAIRHFAQKTDRVVFVFLGSNRRTLRHMFNDNNMPLYQLCDTITLDKIAQEIYIKYLRKVSEITWHETIPDSVIFEILALSERHPRRVYNLCLYLWRIVDTQQKIPKVQGVREAWSKLIAAEAKSIRYFLSQKNTSQLKVLVYIALNNKLGLTSKTAQKATNLPSTAISKALQKLEQDDIIPE